MENTEKKSTRKPNWSSEQALYLTRLVEENKNILLSKFGPGVTSLRKKETWLKITSQINAAFTGCVRTMEEVEKKWHNIQSKSKTEIAAFKKSSTATGGGPSQEGLNQTAEVVWDILGKDNVSISGIPDSMDTTLLQLSEPSDVMSVLDIQTLTAMGGSLSTVRDVDIHESLKPPKTQKRLAIPHNESYGDLLEKKIKLEIDVLELKKKLMEEQLKKIMEE